jgi:hypothetical protein
MQARAEGAQDWWSALRFDVVSVVRCTPDGPQVAHLKGAF